jgi:nucleotide-binding universal stress UspA family protein
MKKVLIALDYDPSAQKVAESGYFMAKSMGAETTLLHIITDPVYYSSTEYSPITGYTGFMDTGQLAYDNIETLEKASQHFLDHVKKHLDDNDILTLVKEGDLGDAILKAAKKMHADVIVMGSHSRRWLENIVIGSVTEKVLRHTNIPLFIIPTRKRS